MKTLDPVLEERKRRAIAWLQSPRNRRSLQTALRGLRKRPRNLERKYAAMLKAFVEKNNAYLLTKIKSILAVYNETVRIDSLSYSIGETFDELDKWAIENMEQSNVKVGVSAQGELVAAATLAKWDNAAFDILALNDLPVLDKKELLSSWTRENLSLIRGVTQEQIKTLETGLLRNTTAGMRASELEAFVMKTLGIGVKRAQLIAIDQTNKLSGQIDRLNQVTSGIPLGIWRTSRDERVRVEHRALEGTVIDINNPPSEGLPGQPIRCRCTMEPVLDSLLDPKNAPKAGDIVGVQTILGF
jgi:SPP1 gp7 family putative phage head morphogenesis protein